MWLQPAWWWLFEFILCYVLCGLGFFIDPLYLNWKMQQRNKNYCNGVLRFFEGYAVPGQSMHMTVSPKHIELGIDGISFDLSATKTVRSYKNCGVKLWLIDFENFNTQLKGPLSKTDINSVEVSCFDFQLHGPRSQREWEAVFVGAVKDLLVPDYDENMFSEKLGSAMKTRIQTCYRLFCKEYDIRAKAVHLHPKYRKYYNDTFLPHVHNMLTFITKDNNVYLDVPKLVIEEVEIVKQLPKSPYLEYDYVEMKYPETLEFYQRFLDSDRTREWVAKEKGLGLKKAGLLLKKIESSVAFYKSQSDKWPYESIYKKDIVNSKIKFREQKVVEIQKRLVNKSIVEPGKKTLKKFELNEEVYELETPVLEKLAKQELQRQHNKLLGDIPDLELRRMKNKFNACLKRRRKIARTAARQHRKKTKEEHELRVKLKEEAHWQAVSILMYCEQDVVFYEEVPGYKEEEAIHLDRWSLVKWRMYKIRFSTNSRRATERVLDLKLRMSKCTKLIL